MLILKMFVNVVIDHNHIWDPGIKLDLYKRNNPGLSKQTQKRFTYFTPCSCDNYQNKWRISNEVDIDYMMD